MPVVLSKERTRTGGRVVVAGSVARERSRTGGRVDVTGCVLIKRTKTDGRVVEAGGVAMSASLPRTVLLLLSRNLRGKPLALAAKAQSSRALVR